MKISISRDELQKRKLFVAVPMYGGQCSGMFTRSIADLSGLCTANGIQISFYFLFNESLITRARNYCADEFLRSDSTHLLFVDSDIGFDARDVIAMLALQSPDATQDSYDIIAGPYPKKVISWEKIKTAVDKGMADQDPNALEKYVGDYVFNPVQGTREIPIGEPVEVMEAGTGFMMIRRNTFEKFKEAYPKQAYLPDHVRTVHFDGSREIYAFFDTPIDGKTSNINNELEAYLKQNPAATHEQILEFVKNPNDGILENYSKRYLSEDYMFCRWVRNIGLHVWFCPWMKLQHVGMFVFGGSIADLAQIGANPTADIEQLKKKK